MKRPFLVLYEKLVKLAQHRSAPVALFLLGFAESSFFRVPPDILLAPMVFANRQRAWYYASLTTVAAVLGSLVGYSIGWFFFQLFEPYLIKFGYEVLYLQIVSWFQRWGSWALFVASFTPIPYRGFTIVAGALHLAMGPFLLATIAGRGLRYFLLTTMIVLGGERAERFIQRYIDFAGWVIVVAMVSVIIFVLLINNNKIHLH